MSYADALKKDIEELRKWNGDLKISMEELRNENDELNNQICALESENIETRREIDNLEWLLCASQKDVEELSVENDALNEEVSELEQFKGKLGEYEELFLCTARAEHARVKLESDTHVTHSANISLMAQLNTVRDENDALRHLVQVLLRTNTESS